MKNRLLLSICLLLLTGLVVGCSVSVDEEIKKVETAVEEAFTDKALETNEKYEDFSYYLPTTMKIDSEEGNNNLIIKKGNQLFILFVNPNEEPNSKVMFESSGPESQDDLVVKTFEDQDRFGYIIVKELDKNLFEIVVGIGGVKMTTQTKASEILESAQQMMEIVASVRL